jgi:sugar (pentulose or hexulose) kinase
VDSIDSHGHNVALLRENESKTTVIWLYQDQEGEDEAAEDTAKSGPAF